MNDLILLLSACLNVVSVVVDKKATKVGSAWECTVVGIVFQFLISLPFVFLIRDSPWPSTFPFLLLLGLGVLTASARTFWFIALKGDLLTRLAPFRRLSTIFTLLLGIFFLGEGNELRPYELVGAFVMVGGGLLVSLDRYYDSSSAFFSGNRYVGCVLYFAFSVSLLKAGEKIAIDDYGVTVFQAYFIAKLGQLLFVAPGFFPGRLSAVPWLRDPNHGSAAKLPNYTPLFLSHILQMSASLLFLSVLSKQALTLSEPIAAVSPILIMILGRYYLNEKDNKFHWRLSAVLVMTVGYFIMKGIGWS